MKTLARAAFAGTAMTAAVVLGMGTASAAVTIGAAGSAADGIPTVANQVCGTAYVGTPVHVGAPPATAKAVGGVTITGQLYDVFNNPVSGGSMTTTTAANGTWCMTGTSSMPAVVTFGGYVVMGTNTPTVTDGGVTKTGAWSGAGDDANLDAGDFYDHGYASPSISADRAYRVHFVYS